MKILYHIYKHSNEGVSDKKHAPLKIGAILKVKNAGYYSEGYEAYDPCCCHWN